MLSFRSAVSICDAFCVSDRNWVGHAGALGLKAVPTPEAGANSGMGMASCSSVWTAADRGSEGASTQWHRKVSVQQIAWQHVGLAKRHGSDNFRCLIAFPAGEGLVTTHKFLPPFDC
jgi:hypothetical protein